MQARQDKTDDDVKKLEDEIKNLRIELTVVGVLAHKNDIKLEGLIEKNNVEGISVSLDATDCSVDKRMKSIVDGMAESMEIEKRKNNIVFHGLKEAEVVNLDDLDIAEFGKTADQEFVEELLRKGLRLDATRHIEEVQRIGRFVAGRIRPLRVRIKTNEARNEILKKARDLKDCEDFKRVYIAPDLSRKQQECDKDLREHVKKF